MTREIMYVMGSIDRGDVKLAYDRAVAHDVEDVAEMIITFAEYIGRLEKQRDELLAAAEYALPYLQAFIPCPRDGANGDKNCIKRIAEALASVKGESK